MAEARRKTTVPEHKELVEYRIKYKHEDYKGTASIYDFCLTFTQRTGLCYWIMYLGLISRIFLSLK